VKRSLAHTVWECKYHIVWVPKKRRKIIFGKLRQEIGAILWRLCEYKGVELLEGKACIDQYTLVRVGTMSAQWVWMRQRQGNTSKTKKRMNQ